MIPSSPSADYPPQSQRQRSFLGDLTNTPTAYKTSGATTTTPLTAQRYTSVPPLDCPPSVSQAFDFHTPPSVGASATRAAHRQSRGRLSVVHQSALVRHSALTTPVTATTGARTHPLSVPRSSQTSSVETPTDDPESDDDDIECCFPPSAAPPPLDEVGVTVPNLLEDTPHRPQPPPLAVSFRTLMQEAPLHNAVFELPSPPRDLVET